MKKWSVPSEKKVPQALQELLEQQSSSCASMIDEKDKLIGELQEDLKSKDDQYVRYLKKQADDVDLLLERTDEETRVFKKACKEEIQEIENAFALERKELLERNKKAWEGAVADRRAREVEYLKIRETRIDENEKTLQHLRTKNAEEVTMIKVKLETDIQVLQQQIQQMKATFQLNAEKLEYNFQVLKKRDEENTMTISHQKRRLTRLQDTLNTLRRKLRKQEASLQEQLIAAMEEYKRSTEQYRELQKKVKHFQYSDSKRFYDIWVMNEERVRMMVGAVLNADEIIHRQQLGLEWSSPSIPASPMHPFKFETQCVSEATLYASQVISETEGSPERIAANKYSTPLVKQVLTLLSQEAGFLIEAKLLCLLEPLEEEERLLMKLDSIFKALAIETQEDIQQLVGFCLQLEPGDKSIQVSPSPVRSTQAQLIHPNDVSQMLRTYVENRQAVTCRKGSGSSKSLQATQSHSELLEGSFWKQMVAVLPKSHEKVWTALLEGLSKYHTVLLTRVELLDDTASLRQQNVELRTLLSQYMDARINRELHVPPTLVLPMSVAMQSS